jgi:hypothetical protein
LRIVTVVGLFGRRGFRRHPARWQHQNYDHNQHKVRGGASRVALTGSRPISYGSLVDRCLDYNLTH